MITKEQIENDLKEAIRTGDDVRKRTLRMVLSSIKLAEVDRKKELEPGDLIPIVQKEVKSRLETIEEAEHLGREDLLKSTQAEIDLLETYLPAPLDDEQMEALIHETIDEIGASTPKDMGKVMQAIMPKIQGRADGKVVSAIVQQKLADT
jgi:uncharacterized protein YqeY